MASISPSTSGSPLAARTETKNEKDNLQPRKSSFRDFWTRKHDPNKPKKSFKFVNFAPKRQNREHGDTPNADPSPDSGEGDLEQLTSSPGSKSGPSTGRRQLQLFDAQKRHRERKRDYTTSLEEEIAKFRHLTSSATRHLEQLKKEQVLLLQTLQGAGIPIEENYSLTAAQSSALPYPAIVSVQLDSIVGSERTFVQQMDLELEHGPGFTPDTPSAEQLSFSALDFILALEHPCRHHVVYPGQPLHVGEGPRGRSHMMTMTQSVLDYSHEQSVHNHNHAAEPYDCVPTTLPLWTITQLQIERLLDLSDLIELPEGIVTPAQLYRFIKTIFSQDHLPLVMRYLKAQLGPLMKCMEFGAYVDQSDVVVALKAYSQ